MLKTCSSYHKEFPTLCFHTNRHAKDGFNPQCKKCRSEHGKKWYADNTSEQKARVASCREEKIKAEDRSYGQHCCSKCGQSEPQVRFHRRKVSGKYYKRHACVECLRQYKVDHPGVLSEASRIRVREAQSIQRRKIENLPKIVLHDCKCNDKVKGRRCDLTLHDVVELLKSGLCSYCGDTESRLTLDRIDNEIGHLVSNVRVACMRCNGIRCNMPFTAWIAIVPAIRSARENGLFGSWHRRTRPRRS